ncbi:DUF6794 domain-containing protein [Undibacterium sp.]|jgi:hypothetical protein|uniref:DUF6794 domain-containing protein n=1 Tax=Undibacterium sp. TaxID=1914977 RepID=UPI002C231CB6|nr:DUF6794 domain-containing protein [Undibacterium sp.]HTD03799.1 DUF6794 domain-containing protein [Undibacterium sp.]
MHSLKMIAETMTALLIPLPPAARSRKSRVLPQDQWPANVDEAVASLLSRMSAQDKAMVKATRREDLIIFHHGWSNSIRRYYGLDSGNRQLLNAAIGIHGDADHAAMKIIEAVWAELQRG